MRTGISGVIATAVDVLIMILLVEWSGLPVGIAAFLGAMSGAFANFTVSKYWAFRDTSRIDPRQVATFAAVALCTGIMVATSVHVLATMVGVQYVLAKGISAVLVFLLWSYPAQAKLVFTRAPAVVPRPRGNPSGC